MSDKVDTKAPETDSIASPHLAIQPDDPRLKPLKPQQRVFAMAFGLPGSSTFGHGMKSYQEAYPGTSNDVAKVCASQLLTNPNVSRSVAEIINSAGLGVEVRADQLHRIISHRDIGQSVSVVKRVEDKTITRTKAGPGYRDALKAIETLNKMDGTYDRNRAAADVAVAEYRDLRKRFFTGPVAGTKAPRTHVETRVEGSAPPIEVAQPDATGQVDTRRKAGRPRKRPGPRGAGGGLGSPTGEVVSLVPEADKISTGGGI